jgi:GNAT superfamily N-acetyltransferase
MAAEFNFYDFTIVLNVGSIGCDEDDVPRTDYRGDIRKLNEEEQEELVGRVRFFVFHFDTMPHDPDDAFDHLAETAVYSQLLDKNGDLSPDACKALGIEDPYLGSVLVFDRLEILPEARGRGLGLKIIERLIAKIGLGCHVAVMKSFPLQLEVQQNDNPDEFEQRMAVATIPGTKAEVHKRLARYYRRAGFRPVRGTDHLMIKLLG